MNYNQSNLSGLHFKRQVPPAPSAAKNATASIVTTQKPKEIWGESLKLLAKLVESERELSNLSFNVQRLEKAASDEKGLSDVDQPLLDTINARIDESKKAKTAFETQRETDMEALARQFNIAMLGSRPKGGTAPASPVSTAAAAPSPALPSAASPTTPRAGPPTQPASMAGTADATKLQNDLAQTTRALEAANKALEASTQTVEALAAKVESLEQQIGETSQRVLNWSSAISRLAELMPETWPQEGKVASVTAVSALDTRVKALESGPTPDPRLRSAAPAAHPGGFGSNPYATASSSQFTLEALGKKISSLESALQNRQEWAGDEMLVDDATGEWAGRNESAMGNMASRKALNDEIEERQKVTKAVADMGEWKTAIAKQLETHSDQLYELRECPDAVGYIHTLAIQLFKHLNLEMPGPPNAG